MTPAKIKSIVKGLNNQMAKVAKTRDELDEFIDTLEHLKENCREAHDALQTARDALSELV